MAGSRISRFIASIFVVAVAACGWASAAQAAPPGFIFWDNLDTGRIGRANIDGTGVNQSFITGAHTPAGVALDDQYVYWANYGSGTIGRATIKGTDVKQTFITGADHPKGVAVDGQHIYWTNNFSGTIGRANLDGSGVNQNFIRGATDPFEIAVNSKNIYWTNGRSIGRANLDGTGVNQTFINNVPGPAGIALDSNYVYWGTTAFRANLGRAKLDGTGVTLSFIPAATDPAAVAVSGDRIYWGSLTESTIGEAKIDGTSPDNSFITGADEGGPVGLAVNGAALPRAAATPTALAYGSHPLNDYGTPLTVTITNTGTAPVHIAAIQLGGTNARDFLIAQDNCSGNFIIPGPGCTIQVLFGPQAAGSRAGTLSVMSDDPLSPLQIPLSGRGTTQKVGAPRPVQPTITCKTATKGMTRIVRNRRRQVRVSIAQCTGQPLAALGRFSTARATISRGAVVFASGSAARSRKGSLRLSLTVRRTLRPGIYALSTRYRQRRRWVIRGAPVTLVSSKSGAGRSGPTGLTGSVVKRA
ncbi:MAG: choice-of-anchor D domain-containing protein [Solirubrobacterales bacterium]|nr:choice-of-anchor D domain-containing protein [Solirubrobacterales bacterium]